MPWVRYLVNYMGYGSVQFGRKYDILNWVQRNECRSVAARVVKPAMILAAEVAAADGDIADMECPGA